MPDSMGPRNVVLVCMLIALTLAASVLKLAFFGTTPSSDSGEYAVTAMYFAGEGVTPPPHRLLKPLAPLVIASIGQLTGYDNALIVQSIVMYFALMIVLFLLARDFSNSTELAVIATLLSGLSYPILKYGIDVYIETGALFFYVLSLLLTLRFARNPNGRLYAWNVFVVTLGSLWKEYSVVSGAALGIVLVLHPALSVRVKALYAGAYAAVFLSVQAFWQYFVLIRFHWSYLYLLQTSSAGMQHGEFTMRNIVKSTAALLGVSWMAVPFGLKAAFALDTRSRLFIAVAALVPLSGYLYGYVSSRLLYVVAVPFLLIALLAMRSWDARVRYIFVAITIAANIAWLFLSYRIRL